MSDSSPDYVDSCGTCYEVRCNPSTFADNYGEALDRKGACIDPSASLVFRTTDTCPCNYPGNSYSNKRWCCGDMPHFDLSVWGFERLANTKWGVIGIQYRRVPCTYQPDHQASTIQNPTPGENPPSWDTPKLRDWEDAAGASSSVTAAYTNGGMQAGWKDASYNVQSGNVMASISGGGQALCRNIDAKGAIVLQAWNGAFANHIGVEVWVYMSTKSNIDPGTVIVIGGDVGECADVDLRFIKPTGLKPSCTSCSDYWWRFEVYFSAFLGYGPATIINNAKFFNGCGGNSVQQLNYIEVRNYDLQKQETCIDHVRLV
ncbi:Expansin-A32 [Tetrabaena socialis]|uniref:Expansin-A32 n=1 Tax=Tetrabaena socialis TaxID=47790 RepID=A0A2J8AGJ5_9CHLO|nr:Expansin-A32 [Tetrabaena socialis]|eukprot:PNH11645.1 Expansin-A32 [Tetrabaena socialis]